MYNISYLFCAILFGAFVINSNNAAPSSAFIMGHEAEQNQFPWQASVKSYLDNDTVVICGGVLLSNEWILTAASCLYNNTKEIRVGLGSNHLQLPEVQRNVIEIIINPNYNPKLTRLPNHNVALLRLNTTVNFSDWLVPIKIPGQDQKDLSFEGVKARHSGWGTTVIQIPNKNQNNNDIKLNKPETSASDILNWHELTVISNDDCKSLYFDDVQANILCTRVVSGGNVCGCDIGGPLVILDPDVWKLIGISSYTPGCNSPNPAAFSRITSYLSWLSDITGINIDY